MTRVTFQPLTHTDTVSLVGGVSLSPWIDLGVLAQFSGAAAKCRLTLRAKRTQFLRSFP